MNSGVAMNQETFQPAAGELVLEDGSRFPGYIFGSPRSVSGEVVFNTGMVGYPETLSDPSYCGQILTFTYPLIGNYGIPQSRMIQGFSDVFESEKVQAQGLIISDYSHTYSHWNAASNLGQWLQEHNVAGLFGVDTRKLTKKLRQHGSMLGKISGASSAVEFYDPNRENLVQHVSVKQPELHGGGKKKIVLIDCGSKLNIIRSLLKRDATVYRVPWRYDFLQEDYDGIVLSNGPGDPKMCPETISLVKKLLNGNRPILGICLGHQILSLAAGADTYKLKFGHHSQNQPCIEIGTERCYITSQNHGYAVKPQGLPADWMPWFTNANDGTNEGIKHRTQPFMSVQFHPEATPGPTDTSYLFDRFLELV